MSEYQIHQSGLDQEQKDLAKRLREIRKTHKLSQERLAREIGITRAAYSNYEYARVPLPFTAGLRFCECLNVNQRYLAHGFRPERPFIPLEKLGIGASTVSPLLKKGVDFIKGFESVLKEPILAAIHSDFRSEAELRRTMNPTAIDEALRYSGQELELELFDTVAKIRTARREKEKLRNISRLIALATALRGKLEIRRD